MSSGKRSNLLPTSQRLRPATARSSSARTCRRPLPSAAAQTPNNSCQQPAPSPPPPSGPAARPRTHRTTDNASFPSSDFRLRLRFLIVQGHRAARLGRTRPPQPPAAKSEPTEANPPKSKKKKGAQRCKRDAHRGRFGHLQRPGIEPGSLPWQGSILPLDQRCTG